MLILQCNSSQPVGRESHRGLCSTLPPGPEVLKSSLGRRRSGIQGGDDALPQGYLGALSADFRFVSEKVEPTCPVSGHASFRSRSRDKVLKAVRKAIVWLETGKL